MHVWWLKQCRFVSLCSHLQAVSQPRCSALWASMSDPNGCIIVNELYSHRCVSCQRNAAYVNSIYRKESQIESCICMVHHTTIDNKWEHPQHEDCPTCMWRPREAGVDIGQVYKGWSVVELVKFFSHRDVDAQWEVWHSKVDCNTCLALFLGIKEGWV